MTIDPVAVYAAVVATAALGWEVYHWRFERKGHLDIAVLPVYAGKGHASLMVTMYNSNDFPVRIGQLRFTAWPTDGTVPNGVFSIYFNAHAVGLPTVVPAHDSVQFLWGQSDLDAHLPGLAFLPGYRLTVSVNTSLAHSFSGTAAVQDITDKLTDDMKKKFDQGNT